MRTYEDQLQMRTLFQEGDLICAEIQNVHADGLISLHTRSLKYGKLENGQCLQISATLVKRLPQHFLSLPIGIDIILGKNGFVWLTRTIPSEWHRAAETAAGLDFGSSNDVAPLAEILQIIKQRHVATPIGPADRLKMARIANSIRLLAKNAISVSPETIMTVYQHSIGQSLTPADLLRSDDLVKSLFNINITEK